MDSQHGRRIKNRLAGELALPLRSSLAFDFPTVEKLSEYLVQVAQSQTAPPALLQEAPSGGPGVLADIPEQMEAMLAEKLARLEELTRM